MNQVLETIQTRRSIRKFNTVPVGTDLLEQIVEAGRYAPTGGNCQTVHFTVITNPQVLLTLREIVQQAFAHMVYRDDLYASMKNSIRLSQAGTYTYDYQAPVLIVVSNAANYPNAMADCACALQNMMLAATSLSVGSCWINQLHWLEDHDDVRDTLLSCGITRSETICGALALGNFDGQFRTARRTGMKVDWVK